MKLSKNIGSYFFGAGALRTLSSTLATRRQNDGIAIYLVDEFFRQGDIAAQLDRRPQDFWEWVPTADEPTTQYIDALVDRVRSHSSATPVAVVGMGGGITLDTAKAVSNLLTNPGFAGDFQGWDLVKVPGVYKIGIPTISGTGAESSRTCVMTNKDKNIKLGMNSEFSVFDHLVFDPKLSLTVPRNQYFYTAMDAYIHCIESINGSHRDTLSDVFSQQAIDLCRGIFNASDMQGESQREQLMVASYLGGMAIANTFVGIVHPLSAGLSTVLGFHHCVANCIVMNVMEDFYPEATAEFKTFMTKQKVSIPTEVSKGLDAGDFKMLYESMIVHERPLMNALGKDYRQVLTLEKVSSIYARM